MAIHFYCSFSRQELQSYCAAPNYRFGCQLVFHKETVRSVPCVWIVEMSYMLLNINAIAIHFKSAIAAVNTYFLRTLAISRIKRAIVLTEFQYRNLFLLVFQRISYPSNQRRASRLICLTRATMIVRLTLFMLAD